MRPNCTKPRLSNLAFALIGALTLAASSARAGNAPSSGGNGANGDITASNSGTKQQNRQQTEALLKEAYKRLNDYLLDAADTDYRDSPEDIRAAQFRCARELLEALDERPSATLSNEDRALQLALRQFSELAKIPADEQVEPVSVCTRENLAIVKKNMDAIGYKLERSLAGSWVDSVIYQVARHYDTNCIKRIETEFEKTSRLRLSKSQLELLLDLGDSLIEVKQKELHESRENPVVKFFAGLTKQKYSKEAEVALRVLKRNVSPDDDLLLHRLVNNQVPRFERIERNQVRDLVNGYLGDTCLIYVDAAGDLFSRLIEYSRVLVRRWNGHYDIRAGLTAYQFCNDFLAANRNEMIDAFIKQLKQQQKNS